MVRTWTLFVELHEAAAVAAALRRRGWDVGGSDVAGRYAIAIADELEPLSPGERRRVLDEIATELSWLRNE